MALRKYRTKPVEAEPAMSAVDDGLQPAPEPSPVAVESPTTAAPVDDDLGALKAQLHGVRFASKPLEQRIDELGNLSVPQRAWLRINPHALNRPDILHVSHIAAVQNGIQVDSPAYFQLMETMLHQYGNMASPPPQQAPEPQGPHPTSTSVDIEVTKPADDDEPNAAIFSAPVSRGNIGSMPEQNPGRITLSAAQREAARASGVDELVYARNLLKMAQMKKSGLIKD